MKDSPCVDYLINIHSDSISILGTRHYRAVKMNSGVKTPQSLGFVRKCTETHSCSAATICCSVLGLLQNYVRGSGSRVRLWFFLTAGLALASQSGCVREVALPCACEDRRTPNPTTSSVAGSLPASSHLVLVKRQTEKKEIHGTVSGGASGDEMHVKLITSCLLCQLWPPISAGSCSQQAACLLIAFPPTFESCWKHSEVRYMKWFCACASL